MYIRDVIESCISAPTLFKCKNIFFKNKNNNEDLSSVLINNENILDLI